MPKLEISRAMDRPREGHTGRPVEVASLVGDWLNYDRDSRGIRALSLAANDGQLVVHVAGACKPSPCDWGKTRAEAYAAGIGGGDAVGFYAHYDFGFLGTTLAAYLNLRLLVVDTYNVFQDDSGRSSYFMRDHFYQP